MLGAQLVRHARAVVFDLHAGDEPVPRRADAHVRERARAQCDAAALADGLQAHCAPTLSSA